MTSAGALKKRRLASYEQTQPWKAMVRGGDAQTAEGSTHHLAFLWCSHCLLLSTVSTQVNMLPGQVSGLRHASS